MRCFCFQCKSGVNRGGYILLVMLLLIVVIFGLVWLDPLAMGGDKDKNLPWNQVKRIVPKDRVVPEPMEEQPKFMTYMGIGAKCTENGQDRGQVGILISPEGRVRGGWSGDYSPKKDVLYEVVSCHFKGNIDSAHLYEDENGEDPSKLYVITEGNFIILETNGGIVRKASGRIYVTGWIDSEYKVTGKVTITSDKKTYYEYGFSGVLGEVPPSLFNLPTEPIFQGIPLPRF